MYQKLAFKLAQLYFDDSIQILLILPLFITLRTKSNLEGFVCSHVVIILSFIKQCELHCSQCTMKSTVHADMYAINGFTHYF